MTLSNRYFAAQSGPNRRVCAGLLTALALGHSVAVPGLSAQDSARRAAPNSGQGKTGVDEDRTGTVDFQGSWTTEILETEGVSLPLPLIRSLSGDRMPHPLLTPEFRANQWLDVDAGGKVGKPLCTIELGPTVIPKTVDLVGPRGVIRGIYRRQGNFLTLCFNADQSAIQRPTDFATSAASPRILIICARENPAHVPRASAGLPDVLDEGSLPELELQLLKLLDAAELKKLEGIYTRQYEMCDQEAREMRRRAEKMVGMERALRLNLLARFDQWSGRDRHESLSVLIKDPIQKLRIHSQQQSDSQRAKTQKLKNQIDAIRKHQGKSVQ